MQLVYKNVIYTNLKLRKRLHARIVDTMHELAINLQTVQLPSLARHTERAVGQTVRFEPGPTSSVNIRRLWDTRNLRRTSPSLKHSKKYHATRPTAGDKLEACIYTVNSPYKWPVTRKMFPFDDVIMSKHKPCLLLWDNLYTSRNNYASTLTDELFLQSRLFIN